MHSEFTGDEATEQNHHAGTVWDIFGFDAP